MGVRNDEELKNLRKIGIVGVRHEETAQKLKLKNRMRPVSKHVALVGDSMWVNYLFDLTPRVDDFIKSWSHLALSPLQLMFPQRH
jgi:hypothetical protein